MKTNLDKFFKTDANLEKEGVWFDIVADEVGFLLKPFKQTNPTIKAAMAKYYKPYARQVEMGTLDQSKMLDINIKLFVDVCLVDWKGIEADGKLIEFSQENALKLFKELPDLFDTLWKYATDFNNYKEELGNS